MNDVDVSIVMPCLNERQAVGHCIGVAQQALLLLNQRHGLTGEIVIADNGSIDGSQHLAAELGARVISVPSRGYGAAVNAGFIASRGRYLVMGDADGSYNFLEAVSMVEALMDGAGLCIGSRFKGGIAPGAMPWKNRYIGNPVLTGLLNFLFKAGVEDAHCGLRALTSDCFARLHLAGTGMEFASEMIIKAALLGERIDERPATLSPDLRGRPPHLRPWRDGWRHLRYLLMLSPLWLFAVPAIVGASFSIFILLGASVAFAAGFDDSVPIGNFWVIFAGSTLAVSHMSGIIAVAGQLYGLREGYRKVTPRAIFFAHRLSLEGMLLAGLLLIGTGGAALLGVVYYWSTYNFEQISNVLPAVLGTSLVVIGMQNLIGGFLFAIVCGNEAEFARMLATLNPPSIPTLYEAHWSGETNLSVSINRKVS